MGGSSKKTTVGYWYKLIMHFGWCKGPIDAFLEFRGGDRTAWRGELTSSGQIYINAANLWGGETSEGGITGTFDVRFGEQSQSPSSYLAAQLGPEQSAYRGRAGGVFQGGRYGAFNPYPKPASFKLRRILKGWDNDECWYPEVAEIGLVAPSSVAVYFALDLSGSMDTITPNGQSRLTNMKSAINSSLDFIGSLIAERGVTTDIMIVGFGTYPSGRASILRRDVDSSDIDDLKAWVSARSSSYSTYFTAGVMDMPDFYAGAPGDAKRVAFFVTDGEPADAGSGMTAAQIAAEAGAVVNGVTALACYGMNIDLSDTTYTEYVDNTPNDGVPVIEGDDPGAITAVVVQAMLGGMRGMNPAHVIYDCLTSADMQGEPVAAINDDSFRAAAQKLYAEGFGICTKYDSDSESLEDFRQRICNVIGASCTRSRVDGQWYLDLIRGVHDLDALLILTDDDIIEFEEDPSTLDDAVNQVVVAWFDPERKEDRATSPQHSLGAIAAVGGVRSETIEYPEIPIESLALRVAARDLRSKATPLKRFTLTTNRKPHALRLGQFLRLQLPLRGIADMVCMVGDIDTGILRSGSIKLVAVQDVFSMPDTTYIVGEPGVDTTPSTKPQVPAQQLAFEAPYVELAGTLSPGDLAVLAVDAGFLATVARRPGTGINYALWTAPPASDYGEVGTFDWCPTALLVEAASRTDTAFTLAGESDLGQVEVGTAALLGAEIVRVDAIDPVAGTLTLGRGCADTVAIPHEAGQRIWFYDAWSGADTREYSDGETVSAKALTRTSSEMLALSEAPALTLEMQGRAGRPYPPAGVKLNGESYPTSVGADLVFTWKHRDRVLQADTLVDVTAASIGPEPGTTYTVQLWNSDMSLLVAESAGVTGDTTTIQIEDINASPVIAKVFSVRDGLGSFTSHQWEIEIPVTPIQFIFTDEPYMPPAGDAVEFIFEP
ncbi:phage tail protein [Stenotrophomonas pigmentata]|uniref:phage tail protein n=1 Tax=Stenotrophomonas pigmentata TaxID=3055080 RepID=UPI0026E96DF6|nr:phage tail protein [Stenotrophomonas sp. 610A2]